MPSVFLFEAQGLRYGHFLLCTIARWRNDVVKISKWPYLSLWASNKKTEGTFFSPTLKVEEKKVPSFFWFGAQGLRYGLFLILTTSFRQRPPVQSKKWPYLSPWDTNQKKKGTFFSSTFKVGEKKVPSVFLFEAQGLRYSHFLIFTTSFRQRPAVQSKKWPYLSPWASNKKNKGTFFSPTLKVKEKKVPLFFWFEAQGLIYGHFLLFGTSFASKL